MPEQFQDPAFNERTIEDIKDSSGVDNLEMVKSLAASSYEFFIRHVLGLNIDSPLIQDAIDTVDSHDQSGQEPTKIVRLAPRGHSKTYTWTIGRALYIGFSKTSKQIILSSASRSQSKAILRKLKRIVERNELLHHLKPSMENKDQLETDLKDDEGAWAAKSVALTSDVIIKTKTYGSSIRSEHVDYILLDDILSDSNSGSKSTQQEKDIFFNVVAPIVENKGGTLQVVGTPQSHDDLLMELMEKETFDSKRYQAFDPESKEVLWPWNWSYERLMQKKGEVGPATFAREYQTNPMSVEEQFFDWEDCIKPNLDARYDKQTWKTAITEDYDDWRFFLGVDLALSDSSGADYTVLQVIGIDPEDHAWHMDMYRERGMSPTSISEKIKQMDDKYRFEAGLVEKNAIGEGVWDTISQEDQLSGRIKSFDTTRKTRPEILSQLQAALYRNELTLHDDEALKEEMMAFYRNDSGKLEGKSHDDMVMSLAICWRAARNGNYSPSSLSIIDSSGNEVEIDEDEFEDDIDKVKVDDDRSFSVGII